MSTTAAAAARWAQRWTDLYTRGLPDDLRERRRGEIASDLWEHEHAALAAGQAPVALAVDIVLRVVRGMAADLAWRRTTLRGRGAGAVSGRIAVMVNRVLVGAGVVVTTLVGLFLVVNGYGIGFGGGGDGGERYALLGTVEIAAGVLLLAGVAVASRRPRPAVVLVGVGCLAVVATHLWMVALTVPLTIALVGLAVWRARRADRRAVTGAVA